MSCYVLAKNADGIGCVAIQMKPGAAVVELKKELDAQYRGSKMQFVTISRPSAYGEYAPYHIVNTADEFREEVRRLSEKPALM